MRFLKTQLVIEVIKVVLWIWFLVIVCIYDIKLQVTINEKPIVSLEAAP